MSDELTFNVLFAIITFILLTAAAVAYLIWLESR
jgi:hypothetical protein